MITLKTILPVIIFVLRSGIWTDECSTSMSFKHELHCLELEKAKKLMVNVDGMGQAEDQGFVFVGFDVRRFLSRG
jgi:hypothetical protein